MKCLFTIQVYKALVFLCGNQIAQVAEHISKTTPVVFEAMLHTTDEVVIFGVPLFSATGCLSLSWRLLVRDKLVAILLFLQKSASAATFGYTATTAAAPRHAEYAGHCGWDVAVSRDVILQSRLRD